MKSLLVAALVIACSHAASATPSVLFEIDRELGTQPVTPESAIVLYANGAWRSTDSQHTTTGRMTADQLADVQRDVDGSPWTSLPNRGASCGAITLERTVYVARGKIVWTAAGCSHNHLDDASAKNLAALQQLAATIAKA